MENTPSDFDELVIEKLWKFLAYFNVEKILNFQQCPKSKFFKGKEW